MNSTSNKLLIVCATAVLALTYLIAQPFLSPSAEEMQSMERVRYAELLAEETRKDQEAMQGVCIDGQMKVLPSAKMAICEHHAWTMGGGVGEDSQEPDTMTMCIQDAAVCADGAMVGRSGPRCELDCESHGGLDQK